MTTVPHPVRSRTAALLVGHCVAFVVTSAIELLVVVGPLVLVMILGASHGPPSDEYNDGPFIGVWILCGVGLVLGVMNVAVLSVICQGAAWLLGERGGPAARLWAPAALLGIAGCLAVAQVAWMGAAAARDGAPAAWPGIGRYYASVEVLLLLTYWVTLAAFRWGRAGKAA